MVLVLVSPLLRHSLLTLPLEAKLTLVAISPTIVPMKAYGLSLRLGMRLLTWFLLTQLLTFFPTNSFSKSLLNLMGFWKSFVE
jgi:hypothetical protein